MSSRGRSHGKIPKNQRSYLHWNVNYILNSNCDWKPAQEMTLVQRDDWPEGLKIVLCTHAKGIKQKKPKIELFKINNSARQNVYWVKCKEVVNVEYSGADTIRIQTCDLADHILNKGGYIRGLFGTSYAVVNTSVVHNYLVTSTTGIIETNESTASELGIPKFVITRK